MIKLSDYVAKRLKEVYKVKTVFMVSGGGAMHLNNSFGKYIHYVCNHHEQACAISAEGYARVNRELAVVNVTTGPGGLNCLNGVFGQWTDSVPVLYVSGQVKYSTTTASCPNIKLRQLGDQEVDIISVVKPLTKYAVMVTNPDEIKYHLDKAIYEATHGRFGPVWLDIPMNVQSAMIDEKILKEFKEPKIKNEKINIDKIIEKIKKSERPLIVAGHGIRLSDTQKEFYKLIEKLKIPVVTTFNGFDLLETKNKYYIGRIGTVGQRAGNFALQNADTILFLGTRNNIRQVSYNWENFAKNAFKIVVDIDKDELRKPFVKPNLAINTDLKFFMPQLLAKTKNINSSKYLKWLSFCKNLKNKYCFENYKEQKQKPNIIEPYRFVYTLTKCLKERDIFVMANGSACVCGFQTAVIKKNQRFILNGGNASMGYALPASIGASLSSKGRNVICLEGDGSIMMNIQELETIKYNKLPIKIFVINNSGYSSIRQTQRNFFNGKMTGSGTDSGVSVPDFTKIGKAFGLKTKRIKNPKTMEKEIKEVLKFNGPVLCEVMVEKEYSFLPKLSSKKLPDGTMVSPTLEDMFPFLDRKEFEENIINHKI
ncbi:thiamine pyrophosphate-binding protein [Candidatus Ruminimicrobiellum ovillum]|uniref:thiamine pyrophosphate-binding protein n=1 Tax=Candidatus Ruminimicrobiellum ovillum TaxID=1947927 RepID=UPI003559A117